jgi:trk system potassium uptake protein TrkH
LANPGRIVALGFLVSIGVGTSLLMLPIASRPAGGTDLMTAAFTATSATCVTGLVVVDTETYWTGFGQGVLLALMQIGGLGVMTFASLLGLLVADRLGLRTRMLAQAETRTSDASALRRVLTGTIVLSLAIEAVVWFVLTLRFWLSYDVGAARSLYLGLFHAISAYNNAGFALWSDGLVRFAGDPFIIGPLAAAFILGGIGYPVLLELGRTWRPGWWSLHTKLTLSATGILLLIGPLVVLMSEWTNPATLGDLPTGQRLLSGWFTGVTPRTAGFNSIDYADAEPTTLLITDMLMIIGGGSAGTAGGIKVTTVAVLVLAVISEIRGDPDVDAFDRRMSSQTVRQALSVTVLALALIGVATVLLLEISAFSLDQALFEVTSALATVGLSTGITADLPPAGQVLLIILMFLGRVGPITVASALALRSAPRHYRNPESRPIIG